MWLPLPCNWWNATVSKYSMRVRWVQWRDRWVQWVPIDMGTMHTGLPLAGVRRWPTLRPVGPERYVLLSSSAHWVPVHGTNSTEASAGRSPYAHCLEFHGCETWALGSPLPGLAACRGTCFSFTPCSCLMMAGLSFQLHALLLPHDGWP